MSILSGIKRMAHEAKGSLLNRLRLHESYVKVFSTTDGEIVLRHICKVGGITSLSHVAGDPYTSALNEGKRQLALSILRFARRDHGELIRQIERGITDE